LEATNALVAAAGDLTQSASSATSVTGKVAGMVSGVTGLAGVADVQGLTVVHFSAQRKRFLW